MKKKALLHCKEQSLSVDLSGFGQLMTWGVHVGTKPIQFYQLRV